MNSLDQFLCYSVTNSQGYSTSYCRSNNLSLQQRKCNTDFFKDCFKIISIMIGKWSFFVLRGGPIIHIQRELFWLYELQSNSLTIPKLIICELTVLNFFGSNTKKLHNSISGFFKIHMVWHCMLNLYFNFVQFMFYSF